MTVVRIFTKDGRVTEVFLSDEKDNDPALFLTGAITTQVDRWKAGKWKDKDRPVMSIHEPTGGQIRHIFIRFSEISHIEVLM